MARIIFVSEYLRGGQQAAQLANRTRYFATRTGVEFLRDEHSNSPATIKQQEYVQRLARSFPKTKDLMEYEDYLNNPTRGNAQDYIEQVQELYIEKMDGVENRIDYIANRPGVQKYGDHGLWDANGKVEVLSRVIDEVANHDGIVWTPVVSIRREDAERLGYTDAENWRALVNASVTDIARAYKIRPENLRWYAACHQKEKHVHIHMVIYSVNPKEGYLNKHGIQDIKSSFARKIFEQDKIAIYEKQTAIRDTLKGNAAELMSRLISEMQNGTIQNEKISALVTELAQRLQNTSGKKVYGYLPATSKRLVDAIVDELATDPRVAEAYKLWYELREEICRDYNEKLPERVPLSQQKEFKPVRNMVIRETMTLIENGFTFDDSSMNDEPQEDDESIPSQHPGFFASRREKQIYAMAERYRFAKKILQTEDADSTEKEDASKELEKLWNSGYTIAAHQLGKMYRDGLHGDADIKKAELWFRRSAESGNDCSEYALGKLLLSQKRIDEAMEWLRKAADQNNQYARYRLGKVYLSGEDVPKDIKKALEYLTASAEQGNQFAQYTLGKLYLLGKDVKQDKEKAVEWLTRSAEQGNQYAQYFLDHQDDFRSAAVGSAIIRMLHHMGRIFQENTGKAGTYTGLQIDRKRRRKLQEKRIALGHKADDHEEQVQVQNQMQQTM